MEVVGNYLTTMDNLDRRKIALLAMCPMCLQGNETIEHLLIECSWGVRVWFKSGLYFDPKMV